MSKIDFIQAGFTVLETTNQENKLLRFLQEHYPSVVKDNEINLNELKAIAGLPIDEKVNGYGLNFVGRNFARAKYAQETQKELRLNRLLSVAESTTQNLLLKGDNLDSLKILKNHYSGKIKCIYIDPPYNTTSDEFVYPDKFDKEEAEVLGFQNLSESDFARMDFSFKSKKSHNGWLAFMYPRLLLARDLLTQDGVIFISIDDNEQANLKLLCDDVFGEENFVATYKWNKTSTPPSLSKKVRQKYEFVLCYEKNSNNKVFNGGITDGGDMPLLNDGNSVDILVFPKDKVTFKIKGKFKADMYDRVELLNDIQVTNGTSNVDVMLKGPFKWKQANLNQEIENGTVFCIKSEKFAIRYEKTGERIKVPSDILSKKECEIGTNEDANKELQQLFGDKELFNYPKPTTLIKYLGNFCLNRNDLVLDFFAGSGTTGHAVMQLNAEDGGNRKFILCQIDEPIKKDKPAYKFCTDNNLPPVISSITIERLKRAGVKIAKDIEAENSKTGMFEEDKKQVPDFGFKVFDSVEAPKLIVDETGQIAFPTLDNDAFSRIYNMIFKVGLDEPTQVPEEVLKDCIYKIGNHYYITNSEKISKDLFQNILKETQQNGKVYIDGWTASLNGTLQNYKETVHIVF
jgi:adenine-specific DNA-methyltransferase